MDRLLLVRHAATPHTRRASVPATSGAAARPGCQPLDRGGAADAAALRPHLPPVDLCWTSHAIRAVQTATNLGLADPETTSDLAGCDYGSWAGQAIQEVHGNDPEGLARWHADPTSAPHGGESMDALRCRAQRMLDRAAETRGTILAVTDGDIIRAALLQVLALPTTAAWQLDVPPCSVTELHPGEGGRWRVVLLGWRPRPYRRWPPASPTRPVLPPVPLV